jgi:hypothetical protein
MKPRLRRIGMIWYCFIYGCPISRRYGEGFNPADAYRDWQRRQL